MELAHINSIEATTVWNAVLELRNLYFGRCISKRSRVLQ
jgi:hypothetical protein